MGLIEIRQNNGIDVVSARELYKFLEMDESHWKRWYNKNIINNIFFKENEDWVSLAIMASGEKSRVNGNFAQDFLLSIDMAKDLSMLARTPKGNEARKYFIECEKKYILDLKQNAVKQIEPKTPKFFLEYFQELHPDTRLFCLKSAAHNLRCHYLREKDDIEAKLRELDRIGQPEVFKLTPGDL